MKISDFKKIESQFSNKRILVIGDLILDNYLWGIAHRISPEAPVPVVKIESTSSNVGGAGNVAANLRSLGTNVDVISTVGDDRDGVNLKTLLSDIGTDISGIVGKILDEVRSAGGVSFVTADHGNLEQMIYKETGGIHTAHTLNPVPFFIVDSNGARSINNGGLQDVAPTILDYFNLTQPDEMTGKSLLNSV